MNRYERVERDLDEQLAVEIFPQRLRASRDLRGWSQRELGRRTGMPATTIAHFEIRSRKPSFDTLRRLASALEVTTDYLLGIVHAPDAEAGDPLFRAIGQLGDEDRELAKGFLRILVEQSQLKHEKRKK
jgi:transcriptional regulator with XRE-family HTH domain